MNFTNTCLILFSSLVMNRELRRKKSVLRSIELHPRIAAKYFTEILRINNNENSFPISRRQTIRSKPLISISLLVERKTPPFIMERNFEPGATVPVDSARLEAPRSTFNVYRFHSIRSNEKRTRGEGRISRFCSFPGSQ